MRFFGSRLPKPDGSYPHRPFPSNHGRNLVRKIAFGANNGSLPLPGIRMSVENINEVVEAVLIVDRIDQQHKRRLRKPCLPNILVSLLATQVGDFYVWDSWRDLRFKSKGWRVRLVERLVDVPMK